jgi:hypothetical protein
MKEQVDLKEYVISLRDYTDEDLYHEEKMLRHDLEQEMSEQSRKEMNLMLKAVDATVHLRKMGVA